MRTSCPGTRPCQSSVLRFAPSVTAFSSFHSNEELCRSNASSISRTFYVPRFKKKQSYQSPQRLSKKIGRINITQSRRTHLILERRIRTPHLNPRINLKIRRTICLCLLLDLLSRHADRKRSQLARNSVVRWFGAEEVVCDRPGRYGPAVVQLAFVVFRQVR